MCIGVSLSITVFARFQGVSDTVLTQNAATLGEIAADVHRYALQCDVNEWCPMSRELLPLADDGSVKLLKITRFPSFVEPGFERPIEPQEHEVALAGHSLDPVVVLSLGRRRSEVDRIGTVVVGFHLRVCAVNAGTPLVCFEKRPRLPVVDSEGSEVVRWDRRRQRHCIGVAAVEVVPLRIADGARID